MIPHKHLIIISPHFDDVPLTFGGLIDTLRQDGANKDITVVTVFSRSNYLARDDSGNADRSLVRVQHASGIRLLEDQNCLDDLIGDYTYVLRGEQECLLRGTRNLKPGEAFEFPWGDRASFTTDEHDIYRRTKAYVERLMQQADTAFLIPLAIKEHVDHVIVRDAVLDAGPEVIYIGEDQPYAGLATDQEWQTAWATAGVTVEPLDTKIDVQRKVDRVMRYYPSQVEASYREGVMTRALQLGGAERIYRVLHRQSR